MIVRDAEDSLRACLESVAPHVDAIAICDTGSKDRTVEIAREFTSNVQTFTDCNVNPLTGAREERIWDFAMARNASFAMVPDDCEFVAWCDSDDVIHGAEHLRQAAAEAPPGPFAYLAPYEYSYADAELTKPTCIHWRERLIRNPRDMVWTTPCHEVCVPRNGVISHGQLPQVVIKHRAQASKNPREPMRNLRILDAYLKRIGEGDVRAMYYTGVEYARHGQFGKAREVLKRYVQLGSWDDERCLAELELARIYLHEGECLEAIRWAMQAMTTKDWPNPYWLLTSAFFRMALEGADAKHEYNLTRAVNWAHRAKDLKDAETVLFYDPTERYSTQRIVARIFAHWGELDAAAEACRLGLSGLPGDPELMEQLRAYEKVRIGRDIDLGLERLVHLGAISPARSAQIQALIVAPAANDADRISIPVPNVPRWGVQGHPIVVGGAVNGAADWESLAAGGITHVISLTDPGDVGVPADRYLHAPIPDEGQALDPQHLELVVGNAMAVINSGGALYLHCWVGRSRSASFAYAVLRARGVPAADAVALLQRSSPHGFGDLVNQQNYMQSIEAWLASKNPFARIGTGEAVDASGLPPVPAGKLDIVIVTGPAMEDWTPRTIEETGIGGSETMAWEMARGLARLGHRVRHYGWCRPEQEGQYEGVWWYDSARYRDIECDALVVSRYADLVQCVGGAKAKARLLWVHDVVAHNLTPQHALRFDRVLALSNWHKGNLIAAYPFLDPERIVVTRNGIDLSLFENECEMRCGPWDKEHPERGGSGHSGPCKKIEREPHRAVYSSSPDRGLQTALGLWPLVRAEVPDAELHVFYGFDGLRRAGPGNAALADKLEAQCKATEGVVLHGRVSPRELAREFMRSGVWFYPTWFSETSCITAMQAQAAGLHIVTSPIAALNETCGELIGTTFVPGAPGPINIAQSFECAPCSDEYKTAAVAATVAALRSEPFRVGGARIRERFGMDMLALDWSLMLHQLCGEQAMPRFYVDPAMAAVARETDEAAA